MKWFFVALICLSSFAHGSDSFDKWVDQERSFSFGKMMANISPNGTAKGAVIASPSRANPNYFYHWVRDAALVMNEVLIVYINTNDPGLKDQLRTKLQDYVQFCRRNQQTNTITGIGEPKFNVDGSAYNEPWGRPQDDGPALRALILTRLASVLLKEGKEAYVRNFLYDGKLPATGVIKADLEYVSNRWPQTSFDLWEEIRGKHFYTRVVQYDALTEGAKLAVRLGDTGAANWYMKQAQLIRKEIALHGDKSRGYIISTRDRDEGIPYKDSNLDVSVILGLLHISEGSMNIHDDMVLATLAKIEDSFKFYRINQNSPDLGSAIGRYPEDRYDGYSTDRAGNPWYLATLAYGEFYYRLARDLLKTKKVHISSGAKVFWQKVLTPTQIRPRLNESISAEDPRFKEIVKTLIARGDEYLKRVQKHANQDGSLPEQFNRDSGHSQGAYDLTWSYAAFLSAARNRDALRYGLNRRR